MENILIADDHPIMRKKLVEIIRESYPTSNIKEVGNGLDALQQVTHTTWNLILMDINMPGSSGFDTLKMVKQINCETPVLMLSLNTEYPYAQKAMKYGASGFMTKESSSDELIEAIKEIANGGKYITKSIAMNCCKNENLKDTSLIG